VLGGSDAPYGPLNPWVSIASAIRRQCPSGAVLGAAEALDPEAALRLLRTGGSIRAGEPVDRCLINPDWLKRAISTSDPDPIALTLVGGKAVYVR
jgi:predicted amidohydrolase YtcJ